MKVWLERQIACDENKPFVRVAPTTVFRSGDCVRLQFRLNFAGYLKIINLGTSGNERTIFPTTLVPPKTSNALPDNRGWKFDDNPGAEQLVFIVSKSPVGVSNVDDSVGSRDLIRNDSPDVEVYDKDLLPRVENEQVYVLSDATRLGKPIVFRLTLKHR
ncbi:MAG: DUF4384 domain-containing protein [Acidobacteria bacterium]|nr:DUF4384 domain-containing protein [Acidobacteriota bacterium]